MFADRCDFNPTIGVKFAGLVITEFNADRDTDGTLARRFVDAVAKVLEKKVIKSGK